MGKFKFFLTLLVIGALIILAALAAPYVIYVKSLYGGSSSSYFLTEALPETMHRGALLSVKNVSSDDDHLWKDFHFSNFNLPLPLHHPQILFIPKIENYTAGKFLEFGVRFANTNAEDFVTIKLMAPMKLDWSNLSGKLFSLPISKKVIGSFSSEDLWRDLFVYDLSSFTDRNYKELIYGLFMQKMRRLNFGNEVKSLSFYEQGSLGVVEFPDDDDRYQREILFLQHKNLIYPIELRTRKWAIFAEGIRARILKALAYREDDETTSALIYSEYKLLTFKERVGQEGMTYLYAAWSHVTGQKEFLREMIQFLERGKNSSHHLSSLYQYAYKRFGSSFSIDKSKLKERAETRLERKIEEEVHQEVEGQRKEKFNETEGNFGSEKEKIQYFLRKAKDSGINSDQSDDSLDE